MRTMRWTGPGALLAALGLLWVGAAGAASLTAEDAVKIALKSNSQVINAEAGIIDGKSGLLGAYGGILPNVSLSLSRTDSRTSNSTGSDYIGGVVFPRPLSDTRFNSTTPSVSGSWGILDLSSWAGLSAARLGLKASKLRRDAARNDVALLTRRQFYEVVKAVKLAQVADGAVQLARDDERRVKAMFDVGSVSKSDLLKAQVRSSQSEFDQLAGRHAVTVQRVALANVMGIRESDLGEVDTLLTVTPQTFDEAAVLAEASKSRPDLIASEAELKSAGASHTAARMARLPYVTASGSASFKGKSKNTIIPATGSQSEFNSTSDRQLSAQVALRWDVFNLASVDARIASARARLDRAREADASLRRNLTSEVHQQLLAYSEAVEQEKVAERGQESALENLKLTQEKYKVGSATILELIDAQVQLQTAQSNVVQALAAIRVAEAQINRVRGHAE
jgi:outer membrane protein